MSESTHFEKLALLALAGIAIIALAAIGIIALEGGKVDPNSSAILGSIITGLAATITTIISAVRAYSMSAQLGKVTDQLAASGPLVDPSIVQPVNVVNPPSDPVQTEQVG